jgi:light-regulated signal transduction histidine kinase (bacteriophytochrome)
MTVSALATLTTVFIAITNFTNPVLATNSRNAEQEFIKQEKVQKLKEFGEKHSSKLQNNFERISNWRNILNEKSQTLETTKIISKIMELEAKIIRLLEDMSNEKENLTILKASLDAITILFGEIEKLVKPYNLDLKIPTKSVYYNFNGQNVISQNTF